VHVQQPAIAPAARRLRWLLVLLTLTGLGLWQGGHCFDDMSAHAGTASSGHTHVHTTGGAEHDVSATAVSLHGQTASTALAAPFSPGADAGCHTVPRVSTCSASATVDACPDLAVNQRIAADSTPRPNSATPAGVCLAALGISRT
jgi:hypothetical protein